MTAFLINPRRKRRTRRRAASRRRKSAASRRRTPAKRKPPKGFRTWKAYMASIRPGETKRKRTRVAKRTTRRNPSMAKRKRRRSAPRRRRASSRRRRSTRRNPPRRLNLVNQAIRHTIHGAQVLVGKAAARVVPASFGLPQEGPTGLIVQLGTATVLAMVARRFLGKEAAEFIAAGAIAAPLESIVVSANVPVLSEALGAYPQLGYGALALPPARGMGAYVDPARDYAGSYAYN